MGAPRLIRETTFSNQPTVGQLIGDLNKPNITTTTLKTGQGEVIVYCSIKCLLSADYCLLF